MKTLVSQPISLYGSVRVVQKISDGTVAQKLDYDEFGRVTTDTSPGFQDFGYAGGIYDPGVGLVRFGARMYDAQVGRWLTKDPVGFDGGDTNLYGYVLQDPVNGMDPSGLRGPARPMIPSGGVAPADLGRVGPTHPALSLISAIYGVKGSSLAIWYIGNINSNQYLRIGPSRCGGRRVFRISGDLVGGRHIDMWDLGPIQPNKKP